VADKNQQQAVELIDKGLKKLGGNFKAAEKLTGAFSMGKKLELAEDSSRLAYGLISAMFTQIKIMQNEIEVLKANEKH
jgi:hypothetical protein